MSIATPAFFWSLFVWNIFFQPFTFSLYVSLVLRWVSCKQHIEGSCFCIRSASLCLLVGAFNPFTFKVIIDKYDPVTIYFIVLGSGLYTLFANTDFLKGKGEPSVSACLGFMFWLRVYIAFLCFLSREIL